MFDLTHLAQSICGSRASLDALLTHLHASNREDLRCLDGLEHDPPRLKALAHRIKGAARIARIDELVIICERVEHHCSLEAGAVNALREDVEALRNAMRRLDRQLSHQTAPGGPVRGGSYHPEEQQDEQNHEYCADDTGGAVTPAARVGEDG